MGIGEQRQPRSRERARKHTHHRDHPDRLRAVLPIGIQRDQDHQRPTRERHHRPRRLQQGKLTIRPDRPEDAHLRPAALTRTLRSHIEPTSGASIPARANPSPSNYLVFGRTKTEAFSASTIRVRVNKAWEAAGLEPITPDEARHCAISCFIAAGLDWKQISTWAGHGDVCQTWNRYGHLVPRGEEQTASAATPTSRHPSLYVQSGYRTRRGTEHNHGTLSLSGTICLCPIRSR